MTEQNKPVIFLDEETDFSGEIKASQVVLKGQIRGTVYAEESIHLKPGSHMEGEIFTNKFFPEQGATFSGDLHISNLRHEKETPALAKHNQGEKDNISSQSRLHRFSSMLSSWALW